MLPTANTLCARRRRLRPDAGVLSLDFSLSAEGTLSRLYMLPGTPLLVPTVNSSNITGPALAFNSVPRPSWTLSRARRLQHSMPNSLEDEYDGAVTSVCSRCGGKEGRD